MPEYRQDAFSGRWVIIAEERADRPSEFATQLPRQAIGKCPFCAGSETQTPEAVALYPRDATSSGEWQVRVIPNKYPAVTTDLAPIQSGPLAATMHFEGSFGQPGFGIHEVIIESPRHIASFTELTPELAQTSLQAYQDRLIALGQNPRLNYALLFKNCRGGSGATLEHVHSQLLATSILPTEVEREVMVARRHFEQTNRCIFCDLIDHELESQVRIAAETSRFVALCPYASRFPYETWVLPRSHGHRFESVDAAALAELAELMRRIVSKLEKLSAQAAYNFWLHTAPFHVPCDPMFHWHWELIPRITTQAGYEWGAGCFVNPVSPETAAKWLANVEG